MSFTTDNYIYYICCIYYYSFIIIYLLIFIYLNIYICIYIYTVYTQYTYRYSNVRVSHKYMFHSKFGSLHVFGKRQSSGKACIVSLSTRPGVKISLELLHAVSSSQLTHQDTDFFPVPTVVKKWRGQYITFSHHGYSNLVWVLWVENVETLVPFSSQLKFAGIYVPMPSKKQKIWTCRSM